MPALPAPDPGPVHHRSLPRPPPAGDDPHRPRPGRRTLPLLRQARDGVPRDPHPVCAAPRTARRVTSSTLSIVPATTSTTVAGAVPYAETPFNPLRSGAVRTALARAAGPDYFGWLDHI